MRIVRLGRINQALSLHLMTINRDLSVLIIIITIMLMLALTLLL